MGSEPSGTTRVSAPGRARWLLLAVVASTLFACDQGTKFLAVKHLTHAFPLAKAETFGEQLKAFVEVRHPMPTRHVAVVESFWAHRYAENVGAAFSLGANWSESVRAPFFAIVSLLAIGLILSYYRNLPDDQRLGRLGLALLLGGAAGNLADRALRGYVIDFIDWHLNDFAWAQPTLHWATFNVADAGIVAGVGLLVLESILAKKQPQAAAETA